MQGMGCWDNIPSLFIEHKEMNILDIILSIVTALLGGCNIAQLVQIRGLKRKSTAEGEQAETKSLQLIIEGNVAEIARLQKAYGDLQQKYFDLAAEMIELRKLIGK